MKRTVLISLLVMLLTLYPALLLAADLNSTIIHGDAKTYTALYKQLTDLKKNSDEISLQKTLLTKLLTLSKQKSPKEQNLTAPADQ